MMFIYSIIWSFWSFQHSFDPPRHRRVFFWFLSQNRQSWILREYVASRRHGVPGTTKRNFSASLPIIVSGIDRTPQFLLTGSRSVAKSVCGRENIDDYRDADGHRRCPDAKLSSTQDITVRIGPSLPSNTLWRDDAAGDSTTLTDN